MNFQVVVLAGFPVLATQFDLHIVFRATWAFFNGPWHGNYSGFEQCQRNCAKNISRVCGTPSKIYWYGDYDEDRGYHGA